MINVGHKPEMPLIKTLHAFLALDPETGNEGVIGMSMGGTFMPLVAADPARIEMLRPHAIRIAEKEKIVVKLVQFSVRSDIEVLDGRKL